MHLAAGAVVAQPRLGAVHVGVDGLARSRSSRATTSAGRCATRKPAPVPRAYGNRMPYERLSAQDSMFLHIEKPPAAPARRLARPPRGRAVLRRATAASASTTSARLIGERLHLVPRFRRRIMTVPFDQGRPVWVDDEHFDLAYHVRLTALPKPGTEEQLLALFARLQSHLLDRRRPLWELWFVEGLEGGRVALHPEDPPLPGRRHLRRRRRHRPVRPRPRGRRATSRPPWLPEPPPAPTQLLIESIVERPVEPAEIARSIRAALRVPRQVARPVSKDVARGGDHATSTQAPQTPWNVPIAPAPPVAAGRGCRSPTPRPIKDAATADDRLGGRVSLNDVVLAAVGTGPAARSSWPGTSRSTTSILRAMVPVTMRADGGARRGRRRGLRRARQPGVDDERRAAGRRRDDPVARLRGVVDGMRGAEGVRRRRRRRPADADEQLRAADRVRHGRAGCSIRSRADQPHDHQRARPAVPALLPGRRGARRRSRTSASSTARRSPSPCCPTTGSSASASPATATCCPTSTSSPTASATASTSCAKPRLAEPGDR